MIYTLYGENFSEIDEYVNKLLKDNNIDSKITYDTSSQIEDVILECQYTDLFSSNKLVEIYLSSYEESSFLDNEDFLKYLDNPTSTTILVIKVLSKLDERKKLTKTLREKTKVIEFNLVDEKSMPSYIREFFKERNYKIDNDAVNEIVRRINTNSIVLKSELNKLIILKEEEKSITIKDVEETITVYNKDNLVFDLTDAIIKKDAKKLFNTYKLLTDQGEEPIMLIALIAGQLRLLLNTLILTKDNMSEKDIASTLKEHPYRVQIARSNINKTSQKELSKLLNLLFELDYKIKTGQIEKYRGLETFLLNLID